MSCRTARHRGTIAPTSLVSRSEEVRPSVPPIEQLQRPPLVYLDKLLKQGIFTTGLLLEVSETPTRRQYLADQINATTNDVNDWRDEALLLNLATFGPAEQELFTQAGIVGLEALLELPLDEFRARLHLAARALGVEPPDDLRIEGWWEQAHTLAEE
ncbi:MAG TPA: DUF4332 domain-containing protein [Candidatus Limnocylindrales bacterium]|nr:DUF4332 domain-containing protein [Candidatus Limnocylindrales bacterium]